MQRLGAKTQKVESIFFFIFFLKMKLIAQSLFSHFLLIQLTRSEAHSRGRSTRRKEKNAKDHFNGNATNGNNSIYVVVLL
jgi:hypothetical protein